jgi:hypothetical protein
MILLQMTATYEHDGINVMFIGEVVDLLADVAMRKVRRNRHRGGTLRAAGHQSVPDLGFPCRPIMLWMVEVLWCTDTARFGAQRSRVCSRMTYAVARLSGLGRSPFVRPT